MPRNLSEPWCGGCGRSESDGAIIQDREAKPGMNTCTCCASRMLHFDENTADLARTLEVWRVQRQLTEGELDEQLDYMRDEKQRRKWRDGGGSDRLKGISV